MVAWEATFLSADKWLVKGKQGFVNVYCEVHPYNMDPEELRSMHPKGIIFTGGPNSVYGEDSPLCNPAIFQLGVRIIGEVTTDKVRMVQDADAIYREEIARAGLDKDLGQYFAALTNMRSVGCMGDSHSSASDVSHVC